MDSIIKATVVFFALWAIIRVSGRRTLGEMSAFDFVLFMIIGGSTQRAITGQDYSMTNALLLVGTFIMLDIALSIFELRSPLVRHVLNAMPIEFLVENGILLRGRMRRARITEDNILEAARRGELGRELLALPHVDGLEVVRQPAFLEHEEDLLHVGAGERVKIDHGCVSAWRDPAKRGAASYIALPAARVARPNSAAAITLGCFGTPKVSPPCAGSRGRDSLRRRRPASAAASARPCTSIPPTARSRTPRRSARRRGGGVGAGCRCASCGYCGSPPPI